MKTVKAVQENGRPTLPSELHAPWPDESAGTRGAESLRITFPVLDGGQWTVAPIHLTSLLRAVRDRYGNGVQTLVFSSKDLDWALAYARRVGASGAIHHAYPTRWTVDWAKSWLSRRLRQYDAVVQDLLEAHGVDVALCKQLLRGYGRVGTMWWVTDFQHLSMPEMFNEAEREERTASFLRSSRFATRIILISDAVRQDFVKFAPSYAAKARVLQPVSLVPDRIYTVDSRTAVSRYELPEKFIYLPNQFWKHKNHELVFRAVKVLRDRGVHVRVVCTGNLIDYRHPVHSAELFRNLSAWGLREHVICLGLVPHEHVLLLMRQSVCVLNPALFEGWGYSVDEARSLGKRVLLSDIPAHREQNPPNAVFFQPHDVEDLADRLREVWLDQPAGPDPRLEEVARLELQRRRRAYAEQFVALAREAARAAADQARCWA